MHTGANDFGQLGDGTEESAKEPKKVKSLETALVKSVSCGAHCTAAVAEPREYDGTVSKSRLWVWGQNQVCCNNFSLGQESLRS
jgi:alpha-tubulin suppressor-like RCC1 family protein